MMLSELFSGKGRQNGMKKFQELFLYDDFLPAISKRLGIDVGITVMSQQSRPEMKIRETEKSR